MKMQNKTQIEFVKTKKPQVKVFTITPEYQKLSKQRKKDALLLLKKWVEKELKNLN